ncbi:hypothetical protein WMF39_43640 [Sorangium sp. So ce1504]|uniref:hypothetical protein n=1 Tax=Sorangium sp. So ce1504 TaxID=3133337 RepID=UPI003F5E2B10
MTASPLVFPPRPPSLRGRRRELATLLATVRASRPTRVALVGTGGSGKSTLACALGHKLARELPGGIHWFRVGTWDARTLRGMLSLRFGAGPSPSLPALRSRLRALGEMLIVLDNHEHDRAVAELLDDLRGEAVTWVITARRCLVAGVSIFPVIAPLVTSGRSPFPAVAPLTRLLRWNPVSLELADAIVGSGAADVAELHRWLVAGGVDRVRVIDHEDDLPEVGLLVAWAFRGLSPPARRMLAVLAHSNGDHIDEGSLAELARAGRRAGDALASLRRFRLVQEPFAGRFALHATVRHAVLKRTQMDQRRFFEHYMALLERSPERLDLEQTHLFAAMDFAHDAGSVAAALRVNDLLSRLSL